MYFRHCNKEIGGYWMWIGKSYYGKSIDSSVYCIETTMPS